MSVYQLGNYGIKIKLKNSLTLIIQDILAFVKSNGIFMSINSTIAGLAETSYSTILVLVSTVLEFLKVCVCKWILFIFTNAMTVYQ